MPKTELTTMVMIQDPASGQVLVQDRLLSWKGLSFPGGHVDEGESLYGCALREVKEETGLDVRDLKPCGIIHYCWRETPEDGESRYLVFLYRTSAFSGELIPKMAEGRHFWASVGELKRLEKRFSPNFAKYFHMFFGEQSEAFKHGEDEFVFY